MSSDRARAHSLHPVTSLTVSCAWGGRLLALIGKEGRQILRDPSSWLVAFVLPCLFLLFFGYAVSLDADNLRLAVIDESGGAKAHGLGLSFAQSPHFRLVPAASRQEAARMMGDSIVQGVLVLPSHFDARLAAGRDAPAQLLVDGSDGQFHQRLHPGRRCRLAGGGGCRRGHGRAAAPVDGARLLVQQRG